MRYCKRGGRKREKRGGGGEKVERRRRKKKGGRLGIEAIHLVYALRAAIFVEELETEIM